MPRLHSAHTGPPSSSSNGLIAREMSNRNTAISSSTTRAKNDQRAHFHRPVASVGATRASQAGTATN